MSKIERFRYGPRDKVADLLLAIQWCLGAIFFLLLFIYGAGLYRWLHG